MAIVMLVNLYAVRVILKGLGAEDYGIYNVVAGLVTMLSTITGVLSSATQRFFSFSLGQGDTKTLQNVFSASLNIYLIIGVIVLAIGETIGLWFVNAELVIPEERMAAANLVYQFSLISIVAAMLQTPFSAASIAHEDMYIFALISTLDCFLKLFIAIGISYVSFDKLVYYGFALMCVSLFTLTYYFFFCKRKYEECHYKKVTDKSVFKGLLSFSGWTLVTSGASIALNQIITIILNIFFGPIIIAARTIATQIYSSICTFTGSFIMAVQPPMVKSYAEGNHNRLNSLFYMTNKFILYGLLMISIPLFFEMPTILKLWLGQYDADTLDFSRMMVIYAFIFVLNTPISIIVQATGQLKKYVLPVESVNMLTPVFVYFLFKLGLPAIYAFYTMILFVLLSHMVRLICLSMIYEEFRIKRYFVQFAFKAIAISLCTSIVVYGVHITITNSYVKLISVTCLSFFLVSVLSVLVGLTKEEKNIVKQLIS